jgi:hypothetical protein
MFLADDETHSITSRSRCSATSTAKSST